MAQIPRFKKFNRSKISWASYKPDGLGTHIDYCESHIEICEQVIADQNSNEPSFYVIISMHFVINVSI